VRPAERAVAALVIAIAMLDALAWVFLVPLFQSPDEPAHADYAFWIAHHHRLPDASDRLSAELTDPQLAYLFGSVEANRIAFHIDEKAPAGYGTADYWRRIDAAAPVAPSGFDHQGRPVLSYLYPFGYYLIAGIWVGIWQHFLPSLSELYFSLRILNVLMLGATLTLAFGIFRLLGFSFIRAAALLATIGLFPLTSFVSAYCQPDNLSLLLSTAAIFLCLKLQRRDDLRMVALLGLVLGYLFVTKFQFAIVVDFAVFAAFFPRLTRHRLRSRATLARLALLTIPSVATGLISRPVMTNAPAGTTYGLDVSSAAAMSRGFVPFLTFAGDAVGRAFVDFFGLGGASFTSFWGIFGWMDTPLVIGNEIVEGRVLDILEFGTAAVMTAVVLVVATLTVRAARVAASGHASLAVRAYFSNPALTVYVAFVFFIFALFIYTNGSFAPQGRNWLPLIVPFVLIAVDFAPKVFARSSLQRWASNALLAGLLAYSIVGSVFALKSIYDRYYVAPPLSPAVDVPMSPTLAGRAAVDGVRARADYIERRVFDRSSEMKVHGWAYDPKANAPAAGVFVIVDGVQKIPAFYGIPRPDVVRALGVVGEGTGFEAIVPAANLRPGLHRLAIVILSANKAYYERTPAFVNVSIRP